MKTTGKGHLFQRQENGNYHLQYNVNGKRKMISLGTSNLRLAQKRRDEILTPALMAKNKEQVTRHIAESRKLLSHVKYPLSVVWNQYLKSPTRPQKTSEGTLANYERCLRMFVDWLAINYPNIEKINQITEKEAEAYASYLWRKNDKATDKQETEEEKKTRRGITGNTFNYHLQSLNLIFKTLFDTEKTPFCKIQRKPEEKLKRSDFTEEQLKRIFAGIDDPLLTISDKREMKLLCYIGVYTGLRMVDAVCLKWEQIDFANKMINAMPIKTRGIQRLVHIPLRLELKTQLDMAESKNGYIMPVIVERYNKNPDGVCDDFHKILDLESVGLKEIQTAKRGKNRRTYSFHSFRHTYASFCANNGIPISTLSSILGDDARTLEKYYIKADDKSKLKAVMSLPSL